MDYQRDNHSKFLIIYHIIFVVKYRKAPIVYGENGHSSRSFFGRRRLSGAMDIFVVQLGTLQLTLYGNILNLKANKPDNSSPELKTQGFSCWHSINKYSRNKSFIYLSKTSSPIKFSVPVFFMLIILAEGNHPNSKGIHPIHPFQRNLELFQPCNKIDHIQLLGSTFFKLRRHPF